MTEFTGSRMINEELNIVDQSFLNRQVNKHHMQHSKNAAKERSEEDLQEEL